MKEVQTNRDRCVLLNAKGVVLSQTESCFVPAPGFDSDEYPGLAVKITETLSTPVCNTCMTGAQKTKGDTTDR